MAITGNWIPTGNDQQRLQALLRAAVAQASSSYATFGQLQAILAQMVAGGTDYGTVETYLGLQPGQGEVLVTLLTQASANFQGSPIQTLLQRFG